MALLNTGLVIAGGYADKVRKTLFAQLREVIKKGGVETRDVAKAVAELNRILYHVLVEGIKVDKGDVVRVRVEYDVKDGQIKWKYDTLAVEAFRRIPDEEVSGVVRDVTAHVDRILKGAIELSAEKVVVTTLGDHVFRVKSGEDVIGILVATFLDEDNAILRGAVTDPSPVVIDRIRIVLRGRSINEVVSSELASILRNGRSCKREEAQRVISEMETIVERETAG